MSVITLDIPLDGFTQLHFRDGQSVRGCIRAGKLHVTIPMPDEKAGTPNTALSFVAKWSGQGSMLTEAQMADDPRLAALTAKHVH